MFNNKLAESIQKEYRQSAENHRLVKTSGHKRSHYPAVSLIATFSVFILLVGPTLTG